MRFPLIFISSVALCSFHAEAQDPAAQDREIKAIIDFLIENGLSQDQGPYVFDQEMITSSGFPDKSLPKEIIEKVPSSLATDFLRKNSTPSQLPAALISRFPIHVFTKKDTSLYFPDNSDFDKDWDHFYKDYPHSWGRHGISHVGFSKDGHYAMICFETMYASLGGECSIYVLKWNPKSAHWDATDLKFNLWIA